MRFLIKEGPVLWVMGQSFNVIGKKKLAIASRIKKKKKKTL